MIFVTGGAGFIGSNFVLQWCASGSEALVNLDALTYAGNLFNLQTLANSSQHHFVRGDVRDSELLTALFERHQPRAVIHFAAESHVDRSIHGPAAFIDTNVLGTSRLLEATQRYWAELEPEARASFRFLHVSTDEVYGSLDSDDPAFSESTPYAPNSPYAASKAGSDHLVRAWHHTYGLPTLITHCSNNYGPLHFPEKLIPLTIVNALAGKPLPVYGDGRQIRDWLYVEDHCRALSRVLADGRPGETYNIGGWNEKANIDIVRTICALLDELAPASAQEVHHSITGAAITHYAELITYVTDRPGHDRRYAIDARKIECELGWRPAETFDSGIRKTVAWYLTHRDWTETVLSGAYRDWVTLQYGAPA